MDYRVSNTCLAPPTHFGASGQYYPLRALRHRKFLQHSTHFTVQRGILTLNHTYARTLECSSVWAPGILPHIFSFTEHWWHQLYASNSIKSQHPYVYTALSGRSVAECLFFSRSKQIMDNKNLFLPDKKCFKTSEGFNSQTRDGWIGFAHLVQNSHCESP